VRLWGGDIVSESYVKKYLRQVCDIANSIDEGRIEDMVDVLLRVREASGRVFFLGVGGSAGSASHAVNDFRKICGFEAYSAADNVSELTARINDDGWETVFSRWLEGSRVRGGDAVFIFSVGGGNREKNVSVNIVEAIVRAKEAGAFVLGVVGRDGGYTAEAADACVVIPTQSADTITPLVEAYHGVVWHLLVSHPRLKISETKWESVR
jgi:D-sedoheptulose 7-phosphate isomerase